MRRARFVAQQSPQPALGGHDILGAGDELLEELVELELRTVGKTGRGGFPRAPLAHLALVLIAGVWLPGPLVAWFQHVAEMLG